MAASSSTSGSSVAPDAAVSDNDINKLKVIHTLNTAGQSALLTVYQNFKQFPNSKNIKDHLINDKHMKEEEFREKFDGTMIRVIENTAPSGEIYDISLLITCLKVLSDCYEQDNRKRWKNKQQLEYKCQRLANLRNQAFHSIMGLSPLKMKNEMHAIESLIKDIFISLEKRFPSKIRDITSKKKEIDGKISSIIAQPLGNLEIKTYLSFQYLRQEIPSYKQRCKEYGKIKLLDFLSRSKSFHDVKLLFTEVIVKQSNKLEENKSIKCTAIITMASDESILLINSETGGGKTTIFKYGIKDWGEGGLIMNTAGYDYIFPMVFRNQHICSVVDLIMDLIPNLRVKITSEDVMKCLSDPSFSILFYCDGYDERNKVSHKLFIEIRNLKEKYKHIKLIVTSRPQSVAQLYHERGDKLNIDHLQILGILENKREECLAKYHNEMKKAGLSKQSTEDLLNFYKGFSPRHKELYRLPINLVILAWLWGENKEKVNTVKSGAGLYALILDILYKKFENRMVQFHSSSSETKDIDFGELRELVDKFKEKLYYESLVSLSNDRMYIDETGVKNLRGVCKEIDLPFSELKSTYLLTKLEWFTDLEESLELPHKALMDYYGANQILSLLCHGGESIKDILLKLHDTNNSEFRIDRYQNLIQMLGSIITLKDTSLVGKYGPEIISLLVETGIWNNSQWYDIYSDFNLNVTAAHEYGKLIAPHLNLKDFTITDAHIEEVATLLQYVDIEEVTLDISSTTMPSHLPALIDVLRCKQIKWEIPSLGDKQLDLWNSIIKPDDKLVIQKIKLEQEYTDLPLHCHDITIGKIDLLHYWMELSAPAPNMSQYKVRWPRTTVDTIDVLPDTLKHLDLGLLVDAATGKAKDPGLARLTERFPLIQEIGVHVKAGTKTEHLPHIPIPSHNMGQSSIDLCLSQLSKDHHLQWAVNTACTLQPSMRGYRFLYLPRCRLNLEQLCKLLHMLGHAGVRVWAGDVFIYSQHSDNDRPQLQEALKHSRISGSSYVHWYQFDDPEQRW